MEEPRFSMGTVAYDGLIYLVGGCTHTRRHMQELVSYNPVTIAITIHYENRFDYKIKGLPLKDFCSQKYLRLPVNGEPMQACLFPDPKWVV